MLVLSRKPGEKILIGDGITLTVVAISGNQVRVGIEAPIRIRILRAELAEGQIDLMASNKHLHPDLEALPA